MQTFYLSYQCSPKPGDERTAKYSGMLADIFITAEGEEGVEARAEEYLATHGWQIDSFDHAELVPHPSTHDARFGRLWQQAQREGIAATLSPYA